MALSACDDGASTEPSAAGLSAGLPQAGAPRPPQAGLIGGADLGGRELIAGSEAGAEAGSEAGSEAGPEAGSELAGTFVIDQGAAGVEQPRDMGIEEDMEPQPDMELPAEVSMLESYWSATHNSYEGGPRGSILAQLNSGVRALELDIHDNDFQSEGYRLGHFRHGDAVARGGENPSVDSLPPWLALINEWSTSHPEHAPLILTIDLKDNLLDNRSFAEGNLAHLNELIATQLERLWRPSDGISDLDAARGHTLCILSGDGGTRRGYLSDQGSAPSLQISSAGSVLELHDSGSGSLWYWSGTMTGERITWRRHGRYDSGQRPASLISAQGLVIEVHQSESRSRLWASTGRLDSSGELSLASADDFSDGEWPSLRWRDPARGLFSLRYERGGINYEREGEVNVSSGALTWGGEQLVTGGEGIFSRRGVVYQGRTYRVSTDQAPSHYPSQTLWWSVDGRPNLSGPIRYEQLCFVEWQRDEHSDPLLGIQPFGALPGEGYASLPLRVRLNSLIRGWQFSGRDPSAPVPQIPSTDEPMSESYQELMSELDAVE